MRDVVFHFDYISPYSYLAWHRLQELAPRLGLRIEVKPTLLAGLLNHLGHRGPGEIPPKRSYMFKDCIRAATLLNVPVGEHCYVVTASNFVGDSLFSNEACTIVTVTDVDDPDDLLAPVSGMAPLPHGPTEPLQISDERIEFRSTVDGGRHAG